MLFISKKWSFNPLRKKKKKNQSFIKHRIFKHTCPKYRLKNTLGKNTCVYLLVYSILGRGQVDDAVQRQTPKTFENMYVIPKSLIMKLGVVVFAVIIVTINCYESLHDLRKRMPRSANEISDLIENTKGDEKFNSKFQKNFDVKEFLLFDAFEEYSIDGTQFMTGSRNLSFSNTCYEHLVDYLVTYIDVAIKLIETLTTDTIDQKAIDAIRFNCEHIYCLLTFLFDIGFRKLDLIFETIHFLQSLPQRVQADSTTASLLSNALRAFLKKYLVQLIDEDKKASSSITLEELKEKLLEIERELCHFSYKFCSTTYKPLINTNVYYQNTDPIDSNLSMSFTNYVYESEMCTIQVSITKTFRILRV